MIILRGVSKTVGEAARFEEIFNDDEYESVLEKYDYLETNGWESTLLKIPNVDKSRYYETLLDRIKYEAN